MKKFELIYFSDCRWVSEINRIVDVEFESNLEVVRYVREMKLKENENWLSDVGSYLNDENWYVCDDWWNNLVIKNKVDCDLFVLSMCDEVSEVMVIREDSEFFGRFKRDEGIDDIGNIELYDELSGVNDWVEDMSRLINK